MAIFLTADWHLGEDRFEIMGRPFKSVDQMINTLVANHNAMVSKDDTVYMVGDVCYQKTPEFLDRVALFNGKKTLIRGNHDRVITDQQFKKYFEHVIPEGFGMDIEIDGVKCYVTHYPTHGKQERFNLVAHVHTAWKYQLNSLNIGVDVHHFRPVNLNTIPSHLKNVLEYYDDDVWVAYNPINFVYKNRRGKKGKLFTEELIMTRDECKDLLVEKIGFLGGARADEFVAWGLLYTIEGFSETFHPDMLKQLLAERRIMTIEYTLPGQLTSFTFLLPVDTKIKVFNGKVS